MANGFTLVEVLVASAVFTVVLLLSVGIFGQASSIWQRSAGRLEAFQSARLAFDLLTRTLGQSTLNTYSDYFDSSGRSLSSYGANIPTSFTPSRYGRQSDLHFVCGPAGSGSIPGTPGTGTGVFFQAPLGHTDDYAKYGRLPATLNACGYFVEFGSDKPDLPGFMQEDASRERYRYRLKQLLVPAEKNTIFGGEGPDDTGWFAAFATTQSQTVGDNIIALIVRPLDPSSENLFANSYTYNSRMGAGVFDSQGRQPASANQLPPVMQVTMIAIDEASARRIQTGATQPLPISSLLADRFSDRADFETDVAEVIAGLQALNIQYRTFESAVPIIGSKWTK